MATIVNASPTKKFFVRSLTRDIALKDAILDLLDNCIDGVVRTRNLKSLEGDNTYDGFWAEIKISPESFEIYDNCGGIPKNIAINEAFRFGRSNTDRDSDLETVGMYGIGMKRAIFKMGTQVIVESQHQSEKYQVEINENWLNNDNSWELEMEDLESTNSTSDGTSIIIHNLHNDIAERFHLSREFDRELRIEIGQIFALIIRKGFKVVVNDIMVEPVSFELIQTGDITEQQKGINPYQFKSNYDDVDIEIAIGFYRPLASVDEIEKENRLNRSYHNAGVTVICNDRVVVYRDKSHITGWGSKPVPAFHNQFLPIAGVVRFSSENSENLPLTTTKRGLDLSAKIYWYALNYIKEGLQHFTSFTNQWKANENELKAVFKNIRTKDTLKILNSTDNPNWKTVPKGKHNEKRINPKLPKPSRRNTKTKILYYRENEEVKQLGELIFGDENVNPSEIGHYTFEFVIKRLSE